MTTSIGLQIPSVRSLAQTMKFRIRLRLGAHSLVRDSSSSAEVAAAAVARGDDDEMKQSCWAKMPPEILREVLTTVAESGEAWPWQRNVVACAGVCRRWRKLVKEIVGAPEASARLTFPSSLKQPGPRGSLLQCYIKRNRSNGTYHLCLCSDQATNDDGKFLLSAREFRHALCTEFVISLNSHDTSKTSSTYIGKLRSNFLGTKFTVFDKQPLSTGSKVTKSRCGRLVSYPALQVSYERVLGPRKGPRRMQCIIAPTQTEFLTDATPSFSSFKSKSVPSRSRRWLLDTNDDELLVLRNKRPRWHEQLQCWCLNFNGRVTKASVKNFQLITSPKNGACGSKNGGDIILQFGKVAKDVFTMDYR